MVTDVPPSGRPASRYRVDAIRTALDLLDKTAALQGFQAVTIGLRFMPDGTLTFVASGPDGREPQISIPPSALAPSVML
jgi:hypothetical protein